MRRFLFTSGLILSLLVALGLWVVLYVNYSDGYRVGQVIKLSHKGYLFKTWEGAMDLGYLQQDPQAGVATRIWDFSVDESDVQVRKDIDSAIAGNYKVKLYYKEKLFRLSWRGDTQYFVYKVEKSGS